MKVICLALALAAVGATETVFFNEGDAPTCEVNAAGDTVVFYSDSLASHASFKCSHDAGTCQCIAAHPEHAVGGCREFRHTDSSEHKIQGDCEDQCDGVTCQNGGVCIDGDNSWSCACNAGYTGINCEIDINECAGVTCQHGATCNDLVDAYSCTCAPGYEGVHCETDINECEGVTCQNGGTCNNNVAGYTCSCAAGYDGTHCGSNINECAGVTCQNGGTCVDGVNGYTCSCAAGFDGTHCGNDINECAGVTCQNGGTCNNNIAGYTCTCAPGWQGAHCSEAGFYASCQQAKDAGNTASGYYKIAMGGHGDDFYCDMSGAVAWMRLNYMDSSQTARPAAGSPVTTAFTQALYDHSDLIMGWSDSSTTMHTEQSWTLKDDSTGKTGVTADSKAVGTVNSGGYYWQSSSYNPITGWTNLINGKTHTGASSFSGFEGGYISFTGKLGTYGSWLNMYQGCGWNTYYDVGQSISFRSGGDRSHSSEYIHTACNGYGYHSNSITVRPGQGGYPRYAWVATQSDSYSSCQAAKNAGEPSGYYPITKGSEVHRLYCDMTGSDGKAWTRLNGMDSSQSLHGASPETTLSTTFVQSLYDETQEFGWSDSSTTMHRQQSWRLVSLPSPKMNANSKAVGTVNSGGYYWQSSSYNVVTGWTNVVNGKTLTGTSSFSGFEGGYLNYLGSLATYGSWTSMYQGCGWNTYYSLGQSISFRSGGDRSHSSEYIHTACNGYGYHSNSITVRPGQGGYPRWSWIASQ